MSGVVEVGLCQRLEGEPGRCWVSDVARNSGDQYTVEAQATTIVDTSDTRREQVMNSDSEIWLGWKNGPEAGQGWVCTEIGSGQPFPTLSSMMSNSTLR